MGLGSTAKKIQTLADRAEQLYVRLKEVHERVLSVENTVEDTQGRVGELEDAIEHQRVVIEALAEDRGLDVDQVVADAAQETSEESAQDDPDEGATQGESSETAGAETVDAEESTSTNDAASEGDTNA